MTKEVATASWTATARRADDSDSAPSWTVTGSADNGLGGSEFPNPNPNTASSKGGVCKSVRSKLHKGGGSTITCTATLTAQVSGATQAGTIGSGIVGVSYSAGIIAPHAHPCNLREDSWGSINNGGFKGLFVRSKWDSTSGNLSDLDVPNLSWVYEHTSSGGNTTGQFADGSYYPPSGPWPTPFPILVTQDGITQTIASDTGALFELGSVGNFTDNFKTDAVAGLLANPDGSYKSDIIRKKQTYRFHCTTCMDSDEFEQLAGPYTIEIAIEPTTGNPGSYRLRVSAHGHTVYFSL